MPVRYPRQTAVPEGAVNQFFDFINTFSYTTRERDVALGLLTVMILAVVVMCCAMKITRDEKAYIEKLKNKARKRGFKVD
jgi:hypothetical protein